MYIVNAAIKYRNGEVIVAKTHHEIIARASKLGVSSMGAVQGFVDSAEKFRTRIQAKKIALRSGQIPKDHEGPLYSEDLWPESVLAVE